MSSASITIILWAAALGSGLMAGVYFAFSGFIMKSFGNIETPHSVAAMNAINKTILRSLFMPLFFGTSVVSVILIFVSSSNWGETAAGVGMIAGLVYFVGMFVCTVVFNVPLNNSLARIDSDSAKAQQIWSHYLKTWTKWNHLRTVSSLVSCILCIWLLGYQI